MKTIRAWFARLMSSRLERDVADLAFTAEHPDPENRPVSFEPGDYTRKNSNLLNVSDSWRIHETLWLSESANSLNPDRKKQALLIAQKWRSIRYECIDFYSRWDIES